MRVTIIGYSGGGKTTLAKKISEKYHIPHQQIDRIWFEAGGHTVKNTEEKDQVREVVKKTVSAFSKQKNWVSDGFYSRLQHILADVADQILVIELPLWRRLLNHWRRIVHSQDRHKEISPLQDFIHSFTIIKRTFTQKSKLENFKRKYKDKVVILRSHREINKYLLELSD